MKYRGHIIRARQMRNDFGNWFACVWEGDKMFTVNFDAGDFVETRKEVYRLAKLEIDKRHTAAERIQKGEK